MHIILVFMNLRKKWVSIKLVSKTHLSRLVDWNLTEYTLTLRCLSGVEIHHKLNIIEEDFQTPYFSFVNTLLKKIIYYFLKVFSMLPSS